jgi:hypothetical protein
VTNVCAARCAFASSAFRVVAESRRFFRSAIRSFRSERSLSLTNPFPEIPTPTRMPMISARKTATSEATW